MEVVIQYTFDRNFVLVLFLFVLPEKWSVYKMSMLIHFFRNEILSLAKIIIRNYLNNTRKNSKEIFRNYSRKET